MFGRNYIFSDCLCIFWVLVLKEFGRLVIDALAMVTPITAATQTAAALRWRPSLGECLLTMGVCVLLLNSSGVCVGEWLTELHHITATAWCAQGVWGLVGKNRQSVLLYEYLHALQQCIVVTGSSASLHRHVRLLL